ncbi:hypothetical protein RCL1_003163 [Eukaryota sp. TZLM3-RCL]
MKTFGSLRRSPKIDIADSQSESNSSLIQTLPISPTPVSQDSTSQRKITSFFRRKATASQVTTISDSLLNSSSPDLSSSQENNKTLVQTHFAAPVTTVKTCRTCGYSSIYLQDSHHESHHSQFLNGITIGNSFLERDHLSLGNFKVFILDPKSKLPNAVTKLFQFGKHVLGYSKEICTVDHVVVITYKDLCVSIILIKLNVESVSVEKKIFDSSDMFSVDYGVDMMFTCPKYRRRGVCRAGLLAFLEHFNHSLCRDLIAFSQPTNDGHLFAKSILSNYFVYS